MGGALYSLAEGYEDVQPDSGLIEFIGSKGNPGAARVVHERLPVMQMVGNDRLIPGTGARVALSRSAAEHILRDHPEIDAETLAKAIQSLEEPRAIIIGNKAERGEGLAFVTKYRDAGDLPIVVVLRAGEGNREMNVSTVLSSYGKRQSADWVARAIEADGVAYADEREGGRLSQLLRRLSLLSSRRDGRGLSPRREGRSTAPKTNYSTLSSRNLEVYRKGDRGWNKNRMVVERAVADEVGANFSISGNSARDYTPEQREMFRRTGRDVEKQSVRQRVEALRGEVWGILRQGLFDQFDPIKKISGKAYALMRLSRGSSGAVEALLKHGMLDIEDGVTTSRNDGGFIDRVGAALQGEMDDFLWWIASNRAEQLTREEREHLFTAEDIAAGKSLSQGEMRGDYTLQHGPRKGRVTRNRAEAYADALKTYNEFSRNVLDIAEQSGLIDGESRQHWERGFYVPFYRESEERGFIGAHIKNGAVRQKAFERLKGGRQKLNNDLLSNVLLNWAHLIDASAKNRAAVAAAVAAVDAGVAIESTETAIREMGRTLERRDQTFWVMDGGRKRYFLVEDRPLMEALVGLEYAGMRNPIMDALTKLKHWLTIGVTASPGFKIRNLIRDSVQAIAVSDLSGNPFANVARGYKAGERGGKMYADALASGALIRFGTMVEGSHAERTRQLMKLGMKASHLLDSESKVRLFWDRVVEPALTAYNELGNRGEEVNRMALYKQLLAQGQSKAEAALMARDLMDFSMQGKFHWVRFLTQIVPFLNARLQGLYKLGRGTAENPKKAGIVIAAVAGASLALLAAYHDDPEWKKREDWDRDNYWWFKFGGVAYRIPKPFEIGAIGTIAERGAELFFDPEQTGGNATKQIMKIITDQLSISAVPQAVKPILDIYSNKDSFTQRPIESMSDEKLRPDYRFNSGNSMLARGVSSAGQGLLRATGLERMGYNFLSPKQVDHLIRGYTAWLGTTAVAATDIVLRPATGQAERPDPDYWRKYSLGFIQSLPADQSRYVTRVYDQLAVVEEAYGTYRNLIKEGRTKEAQQFLAENRADIAKYKQASAIRAQLSALNQQAKIIERSNLSGAEKRQRMSEIAKRRDTISRTLK